MRKFITTRRLILVSLAAVICQHQTDAADRERTQTFLRTYCVTCHGTETAEASLRLDRLDAVRWNEPKLLDDIYTAIESGEMPPTDAPRHPQSQQSQQVLQLLNGQLQKLTAKQTPAVLKRLSQVEYQNAVNDVLGTDFTLGDQLPLDNIDVGFNNNADHLHMSVVDMESYFNVAHRIAKSVVGERPAPGVVVYSTKNTDIDTHSHKDDTKGFAPTLDRESRPLVFASPPTQIKINPSVPASGTYRVTLDGFYINAKFVPGSREQERLPAVVDVSENDLGDAPFAGHSMSYFLRKNSGVGQSIVNVVPKNAAWQEFDPQEGFTAQLTSSDTIVLRCNSVSGSGHQRMYCLEQATITGPVFDSWPPETPFYQTWCRDIDASGSLADCQIILKQLAQKLYRRPVSDAELRQIYGHAKDEFAQGHSIYSGLQAGIRGMLCSPHFLYKQEGESGSLNDYAIASRLSWFLWNSVPDDRLFELARQGKLRDPGVRHDQTLRMLQDAKADRFVRDFVYQWLDLEKLKIIEPDINIFSVEEFDLVREQIKEEPIEFFREVLSANLSLRNFIDSEFVMITPELNYIYQIEGHPIAKPNKRPGATKISPVDYRPKQITSHFTKVTLEEDDRIRGGLLTQAGFMLMTTNNGEYTNPFYRGAWVLKSFYGDHLETPADLEIAALSPPTKTESIRQTIDAHRENVSCAGCHNKMDPLGIALENLDVIGRWRDEYTDVSNYSKKKGGKDRFPVETDTIHQDGRTFAGPAGLKSILMQDRDRFSRAFLENLLSYGMARQITFRDREQLHRLHAQLSDNDFPLRDIVLAIVTSDEFTQR
ncbi:MAG: DUF1592 domain-containing protein [Planctomycetaceae bacterium]|nr:DUF1592 domain-containing protein [Planctomycetaceae bacterium]